MGVSSGYVRRHEVGAVLAILASQRMGHQLYHLSQGDGITYRKGMERAMSLGLIILYKFMLSKPLTRHLHTLAPKVGLRF